MKDIEIDNELVLKKVQEISRKLDGMRVPELFAVLGTFVVNMVESVDEDDIGFDRIVSGWLRDLSDQVTRLNKMDDGQMLN